MFNQTKVERAFQAREQCEQEIKVKKQHAWEGDQKKFQCV